MKAENSLNLEQLRCEIRGRVVVPQDVDGVRRSPRDAGRLPRRARLPARGGTGRRAGRTTDRLTSKT